MIKYKYEILLITFITLIGSCSGPIDESMVVGKYKANHNKCMDNLEIKSDGSFIHHYYNEKDGKEHTHGGRWRLKYENGYNNILFNTFFSALPEYGENSFGFGTTVIKPIWGNLRIYIDPDLNYYYEKQNN